jgi:hypothetical protein
LRRPLREPRIAPAPQRAQRHRERQQRERAGREGQQVRATHRRAKERAAADRGESDDQVLQARQHRFGPHEIDRKLRVHHVLFLHHVRQHQRQQAREQRRRNRERADRAPRARAAAQPAEQRREHERAERADEQQLVGEARAGDEHERHAEQQQRPRGRWPGARPARNQQQRTAEHTEVHDDQPVCVWGVEQGAQHFAGGQQRDSTDQCREAPQREPRTRADRDDAKQSRDERSRLP